MPRASTNSNTPAVPDESTRLLPDVERGHPAATSQARGPTPLPKAQLGALVAVRIVDPIAYTQIFPYINQLLADFRIAAPEQVGFYSGLIESAYMLAQVFSVYQWGRLSDVVGRRPVIMFGLLGIMVSTIAFGWSTSLFAILASRFLGGVVAGNIAVLHSILVEITDDTNHNIAVPIYGLSWSMGAIVGPLIGGKFANAATRYPKYFSWPIFVEHPYLPPCIITAVCALLGIGLGYFLIEETLPSKRRAMAGDASTCRPHSTSDKAPGPESASMRALLSIPALRALTLSGLALSFLGSAFDVVFALFCYAPVEGGGLGLQPSTIGNFLSFAGSLGVVLRLAVMPYVLRRFDYATTYNTCMYIWPVAFALLPLLNALALARPKTSPGDPEATTTVETALWIGLAFVLALSKIAGIPHSISMLLIKRHAPASNPGAGSGPAPSGTAGSALGRCNGLVQFTICIGRTAGPIVVSSLFTALNGWTWARERGICWAWSLAMVCFAVVGARLTKGIR